jgi:adenylosuccinate lyase
VTDNTELIQMHLALNLVKRRLLSLIGVLARKAEEYKNLACLGYTHFQPAQPTTLGKRISLWLQDLYINWEDLQHLLQGYRLRGVKGASGTQDSFLKLFDGDHDKVKKLNDAVCQKLGFPASFAVTGQTYPRLQDSRIMDLLKNIAQAAHKFAVDFRLMQHLRMVDEPFERQQIGSSAMAYKKNPMRCERICSLARFIISQLQAVDQTAATQWFERTLDDSAGRRLYLPQSFLAIDAVLLIYQNVMSRINVYPQVITRLLQQELPFLATETFIMEGVKNGGDRQELHEAVRENAVSAVQHIKEEGGENRLLSLLGQDERIPFSQKELEVLSRTTDFTGRASAQVEEFLIDTIHPLLAAHQDLLDRTAELRV